MKKTVLSLFMLGLGIAYAAANQPFTYQWHSLLETNTEAKPQCTIYGMKTDASGNVYTLATYGSTTGTTATFLGLSLTGEEYSSGTSYNRNILLVKHDFAGNVIWAVHSEAGDCDMANCAYTPTADGGAFLALKMRLGDTKKLLTMVGSDNQTKTVEFTYQDNRVYQPVFMKISSTGTISFVSEASIDYSPAPASAAGSWGVSDGFAFYDAAEDTDGNLFVAARIARDLTVGQTTIPHHNTDGWDGDSQTTRGNSLILKLDKEGSYQSYLCSGGSATHDSFRDMLYKDGKLYLSGLVYGKDANGTLSLGDKEQAYGQGGHMITACVSAADLSAEYLTVIQGINLSSGLQQEMMAFRNNGNILVGGGINAMLQINTETTVGSSSGYKSYLLEIDPKNGQCLQGYASTTGISKAYGVMERNDSIYVLEYDWKRSSNNDKVFLTSLDKDMTVGTSYPIVNTKAAATAWAMANYNGQFIIAARSMKGQDVSLTGLEGTFTSNTQWYGIAAGYKFNDSTHGTGLTANEASNGRVFAAGGQLIVSNAAGQDVAVYNVLGHCIRLFTAASDHENLSLQSGIYIVRIGKQSTKIIL